MKMRAKDKPKAARIEIIPLIDVIFFLLATMVLIVIAMDKLQSITIELPSGNPPASKNQRDDTVTITVAQEDRVYWNQDPLNFEGARTKISELYRLNPDPKILINGEREADFGIAMELLDYARQVGIQKVSMVTQPKTLAELKSN